LAAQGYRVALVGRRPAELDAVCAQINAAGGADDAAMRYVHDVSDYAHAPALFARIAEDLAPLQVIVYAAGVPSRTATAVDFDRERVTLETNVVGALRWLGLGAAHLAAAGRGTVVGISSVAGDRGRAGDGAYMASKAALSSYLDSLRYRLRRHGVRVVTIKPGYVLTPMTAGMKLPKSLTISAESAARQIARAITRGQSIVYVPGRYRPLMWVVRHLPATVVARLPG
jgi:NAD(P)-dependent dehydrogenase (short-subunit alcohol dehydrogenase family)